ncbi:MAG: glycosyltransferase, partial [Methanomassiliicoccales archaeon]|nr:glycosyltransferase [Methanomassiliicoccales archaeon]
MIYVTVGTTDYNFKRLMDGLRSLSPDLKEKITAQVGINEPPDGIRAFGFCSRTEAQGHIQKADLVITHGGSTLMEALLEGKRVVAVPRTVKFGEALNDHQVHLCLKLAEKGLVTTVLNMSDLQKAIE